MSGDAHGSFCGDWPELSQQTMPATPLPDPLVVAIDLTLVAASPDLLDAHEQSRAARLRTADLQGTFIAAHTALRRVLGWYLSRDPAGICFITDARGKPHLAESLVRFNLTHAGSVALVAVGSAEHLGVDVERLDRLRDAERLAERILAPGELAAFQTLPAIDRSAALLRAWTRKEAVLKALGVGLPGGMERVLIAERPLRVMGDVVSFPQLAGLRLDDLPVSTGYTAALCQGPRQQQPTLRRYADDGVRRTRPLGGQLPTAGSI